MHLIFALAVLATLVLAESLPRLPLTHTLARMMLALGGIAVVVWLAAIFCVGTVRALRHDFLRKEQWLRDFDRWHNFHVAVWLCVIVAIQFGLRWPQLVRANWQMDRLLLMDELLILVPLVVPLVLSWAFHFEVERVVHAAGRWEPWQLRLRDRTRYVLNRARHILGLVLLPVLALLITRDVAQRYSPDLLDGPHRWLVYASPIAAIALVFPYLLRVVWCTEPLAEGPLRTRLERSAQRCGLYLRDILVWHTDGRILNGAIAGIAAPIRYVFLTDALLAELDDEQIEAVFAHEAGHARQHHLPLRMLAVLVPLVLWQTVDTAHAASPLHVLGAPSVLAQWPFLMSCQWETFAVGIYLAVTLAWYSRLLEHEADLWACRHLADTRAACGAAMEDAVSAYIGTLQKLVHGNSLQTRRGGWLHPSLSARIEFLEGAARRQWDESAFQLRVRLAGLLLTTAPACTLLLWAWCS